MSKRIVFCADGTWEAPTSDTNVYKIFKGIQQIPGKQIAYYDDGVGASGLPLERLAGGAFGDGLFQKIKDGYTRFADVYEAGDEIFLFGFSRGAYTARSLAGMIAVCGLPLKPHDPNLVETAFNAYRNRGQRQALLASLTGYEMFDAQITLVGVWDTVGALGIPAIAGGVDQAIYGFLDTTLHPDVKNAYHAISIDEKRCEFPATLWNTSNAGQTLVETYFCGTHGDVGGGYDCTDTALSDVPLSWMVGVAAKLGLQMTPEILARYPSPIDAKYALDVLHDSWSPLWLFPKPRAIAASANLSNSVRIRCAQDPAYRPRNLVWAGEAPRGDYGAVVVVNPQE